MSSYIRLLILPHRFHRVIDIIVFNCELHDIQRELHPRQFLLQFIQRDHYSLIIRQLIFLGDNLYSLFNYIKIHLQSGPTFVAIHGLVANVFLIIPVFVVHIQAVVPLDVDFATSQAMWKQKNSFGEEAEWIPS